MEFLFRAPSTRSELVHTNIARQKLMVIMSKLIQELNVQQTDRLIFFKLVYRRSRSTRQSCPKMVHLFVAAARYGSRMTWNLVIILSRGGQFSLIAGTSEKSCIHVDKCGNFSSTINFRPVTASKMLTKLAIQPTARSRNPIRKIIVRGSVQQFKKPGVGAEESSLFTKRV
ncbi:hypothetical protein RJ639_022718, partial [Escallonia herrerae]